MNADVSGSEGIQCDNSLWEMQEGFALESPSGKGFFVFRSEECRYCCFYRNCLRC